MLYINGSWLKTEESFPVTNPATGEIIDTVYKGSDHEANLAVIAAKEAFPTWSKLTALKRAQYLHKVASILRNRTENIAKVITKEMGKPLHEAKTEISLAIDYLEWYAEEGRRIYGETIASVENKRLMVIRQPVGVVGAITPWNFPIAMITRKLAPALAAGCTFILKPASATPLTAIEVVKACHDAGIPNGVVNLLNGSASEIVSVLMASSDVHKITFTGSTEVGKQLIRQSADKVKKLSLELGGNAPFIVFDDADLLKAVEAVMASKFRNAGQTCVCTNRIYVQSTISEQFTQLLKEKVAKLVVGNGLEKDVTIGPLIDRGAVEKIASHVSDAKEKGAVVITGGQPLTDENYEKGNFFAPTVLANVTDEMKVSSEETFGPIAPIIQFETEEEVIKRANSSEYGLASYIFTKDASRIVRVSEALEYGIVGINDPLPTVAQAPFGGIKESGIGREGGHHGLSEYLEYKYLSMQIED